MENKMLKEFKEAIELRRSHYQINKEELVSDEEILETIKHVVKHTPSAFNSQTARVVVLFNDNHKKLWDITKESLRKIVSEDNFPATKEKIESFEAGYATVLFFEDTKIIKSLQESFPTYSANFPIWSKESSGMHQFNVWTSLKLLGYGASLQHYNELIEDEVKKTWDLPSHWTLRAQMPFGKPTANPGEKEFQPLDNRVVVFK